MLSRVLVLFVGLFVVAAVAAQQVPPPGPVTTTLADLVKGVHLYGCQMPVHGNDQASECLSVRKAILAAAQTGVIVARRHAFEDASKVCRASRNLKACVEALDRRAAD